MGRGDYEKLTPETIDALWVRLREGHAAKPTARQLGLSPSTARTYLICCGGVRPDPRRRARCRLSMTEREEISRGIAAGIAGRSVNVLGQTVHGNPAMVTANAASSTFWAKVSSRLVHGPRFVGLDMAPTCVNACARYWD